MAWMGVGDAADRLGLSDRRVRQMLADGVLEQLVRQNNRTSRANQLARVDLGVTDARVKANHLKQIIATFRVE